MCIIKFIVNLYCLHATIIFVQFIVINKFSINLKCVIASQPNIETVVVCCIHVCVNYEKFKIKIIDSHHIGIFDFTVTWLIVQIYNVIEEVEKSFKRTFHCHRNWLEKIEKDNPSQILAKTTLIKMGFFYVYFSFALYLMLSHVTCTKSFE